MDPFQNYLNGLQNKNRENFSGFSGIKWLNAGTAGKAEKKRKKLLENSGDNFLFKKTKPFYRQISKGCQICGEGNWSCLFITNKCNAGCFYCPASQVNDEVPSTQNLNFETPEAFAEYINFFGFKGVSFSGGEPLLYFDRTLAFLNEVRKKCAPDIYIWMYTNGILASEDKFRRLADAGLNEVRFDIGATAYKLDKIEFAKGIVPVITVEIPAVPEKKELIKKLLPGLIEAGISNLNLHQLRLTKYNAPKLLQHNYTYIHAEQPVVLESELAALEILNYAHENNLEIGVNYCSFFFKNRFQKAGYRNMLANKLLPEAQITEKGFIRETGENTIGYKSINLSETSLPGFIPLEQEFKTYFFKTETALKPVSLDGVQLADFEKIKADDFVEIPEDPDLFKIWQMEKIETGLREY